MANQTEGGGGYSGNSEGSRQHGWRKFVPPADISNALATFLLVGVGIWGVLETDHALELSDRAWVTTITAGPNVRAVRGAAFHYGLQYVNSGKEPATDIVFRQEWDTFDAPANDDFSLVDLPPNKTCEGLKPVEGIVLPPSNDTRSLRTFDTGRGDRPLFLNDEVLSGRKDIYIHGCIAYVTFGKVHHSGYCYMATIRPTPEPPQPNPNLPAAPKPPENFQVSAPFSSCNNGFSAD